MEEENNPPYEINSVDVNKVLPSSIVYPNKKRKFQAEVLGLPLPKHNKCWDQSFSLECDSYSNEKHFDVHMVNGITLGEAKDDESDLESAKDSNNFGGDKDSATSAFREDNVQSEYEKIHSFERPSTSSVNWGKNSLYSLDGRSVAKSPQNDFGLHTCLNFDEHLLEFGSHIDYNCLEHENDSIELCKDNEIEAMLYPNETSPTDYVLSSGRWSVNQVTQPSAMQLTIDKEFEQYFSMLML